MPLTHEALHRTAITFFSREIHSSTFGQSANNRFHRNRQWRRICFQMEMESNMLKKLLGAAAMAAVAFAVAPAHAAKMGGGCNSENLAKTETMIETMADGEGKMMAQKELSAAQDAMLGGKMGACGMHLSKAMHTGMSK
jgi:hypothetical protein